jgi:hypothetical protein
MLFCVGAVFLVCLGGVYIYLNSAPSGNSSPKEEHKLKNAVFVEYSVPESLFLGDEPREIVISSPLEAMKTGAYIASEDDAKKLVDEKEWGKMLACVSETGKRYWELIEPRERESMVALGELRYNARNGDELVFIIFADKKRKVIRSTGFVKRSDGWKVQVASDASGNDAEAIQTSLFRLPYGFTVKDLERATSAALRAQ